MTETAPDQTRARPTRERLLRALLLTIHALYRPLAAMAYGLVIPDTHGWLRAFLLFVATLFVVDGALTSLVSLRPRKEPVTPEWKGAVTLRGEHAEQLYNLLQDASNKQGSEPMQ